MRKAQHYIDEDYPELEQYFINKNDFHQASSSKNIVRVICPCCRKVHDIPVRKLYSHGNTYCAVCGDNYSFPERFMSAVFNALNIQYKYQFTDSWSLEYRYDFQINIGNKRYIVELDGGLGHGHQRGLGHKTPEETLEIDRLKDELAIKNGFIIIRIDCYYENKNRFEYIKNSICNSKLAEVIDLNFVDWNKCFKDACSSRYHKILELYLGGTKFLEDISNTVGISVGSVKHFLLCMMHSGILKQESLYAKNIFSKYPIPMIANHKYFGSSCTPVFCYEDGLLFRTTQDADDYYGFSRFSVRNSISSYGGYCNGKHFEKCENLPSDFDYQPKFFSDDKYREHAYCQWDLDGSLKNIFIHKNNLPSQYKYLAVQRVINGTFETAYGYKWSILPKQLEYQYIKEMDAVERPILLQKYQTILKGDI